MKFFGATKKKIEDQAKIGRGGGMSSMNDVSQEDRFLPSASPHLGLSQLFFLARMTGILGDLFFFFIIIIFVCRSRIVYLLCFALFALLHCPQTSTHTKFFAPSPTKIEKLI